MAERALHIVIGLHRVTNDIDRQTVRLLQPYGLSLGQFGVLEALYHKGDMSVGAVQEKILSTSGTMPLIVKNLEKRGYLERVPDAMDRRRTMLRLTQAGRTLIAEICPQNERLIRRLFEHYTREEQEALLALLKKYGGKT